MKKYTIDADVLPIPWTESPFFYSLLNNSNLSDKEKEICRRYHEDGYIIVDTHATDQEIDTVINDMYSALDADDTTYHSKHYQYTESKRIFELWKTSLATAKLCNNQVIVDHLKLLYRRNPYAFSTINFFKGSNQPLHSDVIHFHSVPPLWMCGVWVALEDVDASNGTLNIIPKSHKWNLWEYRELGLPHPDEISDGEASNYREYENFIEQLVLENGNQRKIVSLKRGQALIWAANLLHGGCNIHGVTDFNKTRLTQAQHYFFEGCDKLYHPMFSDKYSGKYAMKWCNDNNNVSTFLQNGYVKMFDKIITLPS